MVKGQKKLKLGRKSSHKRALVKNLLRSLFSNGYLTTTTIKAKALRQEALKVMNDLKKTDLNTLKKMSVLLGGREVVTKLVKYLSEGKAAVKLVKIGYRAGDMAQTTRVTLDGYNTKKEVAKKEVKKEETEEKVEKKETKSKNVLNRLQDVGKKVTSSTRVNTERSRTRSGL